MELLLSKIKEKKSRAFMILCDIYLFIVIIIIRQLFKTHQTTQEKSGEPFFFSLFARPTIHFFKISPNNKQQKKRGRASQINQIQFNHKVCCQNFFFCLFYIYIYLVSHFQLAIQHYQDATTHLILSTSS